MTRVLSEYEVEAREEIARIDQVISRWKKWQANALKEIADLKHQNLRRCRGSVQYLVVALFIMAGVAVAGWVSWAVARGLI